MCIAEEHAAEECVQDALYKERSSIPPNEPREYPFAYLARIVKNAARIEKGGVLIVRISVCSLRAGRLTLFGISGGR